MAFLPIVGPLIGCFQGVFHAVERAVNSSEHNFKKDLGSLLEQAGVPGDVRKKIQKLLDTGKDEEIGEKINALMAAGIIPPELGDTILQLAEQNGVPRSSLDPERFGEQMDDEDIYRVLGGSFPQELDEMESKRAQQAAVEQALEDEESALQEALG
ncbi:hypothetical protein GT347_04405 [Xylophilus rhododendri]|uniref:Uncharacterized protein n=1 Tax=Xylophilus rhododendri TaxID=2697032 RepID=A0A857J0P2_9BURK|nr:hypothetical protein [Xylophilus rhododendri]QHI97286.1 hypothetical protein GT347_04405 [Xylophilus rhododendri]